MDVLDIGKLRKVNELAKTLTKHGLVANKMEAADLASELQADDDETYALHHIQINPNQKMVVVGQQKQQQHSEQPKVIKDYYTKTEVETVLQDFADLFGREVKKLKLDLEELQNKLDALQAAQEFSSHNAEEFVEEPRLHSHVEPLPEITPADPQRVSQIESSEQQFQQPEKKYVQTQQQVQQTIQQPAQKTLVQGRQSESVQYVQQLAKQQGSEANHPRTGGFNSADVSIEKLFYYGTR